jgi:predicted enzyme related to lactoylglutathione lyase
VMDATWPEDTPPHWLVTFATADADLTAHRCAELGGTVRQPPADSGHGRMALLEDPTGATFAVVALSG